MIHYKERLAIAEETHRQGLEKVRTTPEPEGQKFHIGERVKIDDVLCSSMSHFPAGKTATVVHTYAHAYWGDDVKSYCLDVDGYGQVSWYHESQLTPLK